MNANQNHTIISYLSKWFLPKRQKIMSVSDDMGKREPLYTVGKNKNCTAITDNSMEVFQK